MQDSDGDLNGNRSFAHGNNQWAGRVPLEFLPACEYSLQATAPGFKKYTANGIELQVNVPARVDATLQLGSVNQSVMVTSEAPAVNTVDTEIGRTVGNTEMVSRILSDWKQRGVIRVSGGTLTIPHPKESREALAPLRSR